MGKLTVSVEGMAEIKKERAKRKEALKRLTAEPFDLNNKEHLDAIKQHTNEFENSINQMYLYQGLSQGVSIGGGSWALSFLLPIPDFAKYVLTSFLYVGLIGYVLKRFSKTDFYEQVEEMKTIYNWSLKAGGQERLIDEKLANPIIQGLVKTLAPVCDTEFLLAWPRQIIREVEHKSGWSGLFAIGASAISMFAQKQPVDLKGVKELQIAVESRAFDLGAFDGFKHAISYFASNTDFAELMKSGAGVIKDMLPSGISLSTKLN